MTRIAGVRASVMLLGLFAGAATQAQSAAGRTAGEASVTATGTARYVIPLSLPPGTNGLAPALAVAYDSRGGHGLLGAGFRLEGFSTIQRCGSTLAQDGRLAAVALDAGDRYCLDGQRLRLAAGTYGAAWLRVPHGGRDVCARHRDRRGRGRPGVVPRRAPRRAHLRVRHDGRFAHRVVRQHDAARLGGEPHPRSRRQFHRVSLHGRQRGRCLSAGAH